MSLNAKHILSLDTDDLLVESFPISETTPVTLFGDPLVINNGVSNCFPTCNEYC